MIEPRDDYPFVIRQAATADFIAHAQDLIDRNPDRFAVNPVDAGRRKSWKLTGDYDNRLKAKKLDLIAAFGIGDWEPDPYYFDLIGNISEGGAVHPHTDPQAGARMHIRINLLVRAAEAGCVPLLDGIPIRVGLGDAWLNFASHCSHATTPVIGKTARSIVSYGMQVEQVEAFGLYARYLAWKAACGA